ncbi:MAG: cytochrome c [Planctomycetota bacterium]|nr:cytochrome c [Planctomycetota bacterium]
MRLLVAVVLATVAAGCDRPGRPPRGNGAAAGSGGPAWISGTVDERFASVERHLRGFDVAMVEAAHRYAELHAAGEDRNWGYALYQTGKIRTAIANGVERRPKRAASAQMIEPSLVALEEAARREDVQAFDAAFMQLTVTCNACHQAEEVSFIRVSPPPVRASVLARPTQPTAH